MHRDRSVLRRTSRPSKKPYLRPILRVYGNIRKITLTTMQSTTGDNARTKANHKTGG
jgi:hypothetical protein